MNELVTLQELLNELMAHPEINPNAKINLGFANFSISQAIIAQSQKATLSP